MKTSEALAGDTDRTGVEHLNSVASYAVPGDDHRKQFDIVADTTRSGQDTEDCVVLSMVIQCGRC